MVFGQTARETGRSLLAGLNSNVQNLDALDLNILRCIQNKPGINVAAIWRCISKRLEPPRLYVIHYRIKTLELAGIIETRRVANERRCFLKDFILKGTPATFTNGVTDD